MQNGDRLINYRLLAEKREKQLLAKAATAAEHQRLHPLPNDYRSPYRIDVDRILNSKAYARYGDKTQVVYLVENDHITHRSLHVQLVSHFARGIAEILRLNLDLVEAIALGHDVGHPPFGHEGEVYLSDLAQKHGHGPFIHSLQSCRLFSRIEPLNLCLTVYDGFLCHDGAMAGAKLLPKFNKTWADHFAECEEKKQSSERSPAPTTLEGCLVKVCDTMCYVARDIEDAISLGIIKREELPLTELGTTGEQILTCLAHDIIENSSDREYISYSEKSFAALRELRQFNFKKIYTHPKLKVESQKIKHCYRILFDVLLNDLESNRAKSYIWHDFLHNKHQKYLDETTPVQQVIDYISGMTDSFFVRTFYKTIVPAEIKITC